MRTARERVAIIAILAGISEYGYGGVSVSFLSYFGNEELSFQMERS